MSRRKEKSSELTKEEIIEETVVSEQKPKVEELRPSRKIVERVISFDAYFKSLVKQSGGRISAHHKAPMKSYAKKHGKLQATAREFERLFRLY